MQMYDLILKKKRAMELASDEIARMVAGFCNGEIPDYQMSAMLMAICFNGLSEAETYALTEAMAHSGDTLDLSSISGVKVDKHSTGGVGDKTSLALAPLVAACGVKVAKMSGRGLGHTGGTIDKLESIPGFRTNLSYEEFCDVLSRVGMTVVGQTADLAPADKLLYALRDVTATVDEVSLIASSIMSKKLASGADAIVLDVKVGSGAFMKTEKDAALLAETMIKIGAKAGKKTAACVTDMDQPLGYAVGNALEVIEAVETLKGKGPADFMELCKALGTQMLMAAGTAPTQKEAELMIEDALASGKAYDTFLRFIEAQGGDISYIEDLDRFPKPRRIVPVKAKRSGYVSHIACDEVGSASLMLGAGRLTKDSVLDLAAGIKLEKKVGDIVGDGEPLAYLHANDDALLDGAGERLLQAYVIADEKPERPALIKRIITA